MLSILLDVTIQTEGRYLVVGEGGKERCLPLLLQVKCTAERMRGVWTRRRAGSWAKLPLVSVSLCGSETTV